MVLENIKKRIGNNGSKIDERNIVAKCNDEEEGVLACDFFLKDESGHLVPFGNAKWEKVGDKKYSRLEHSGFTIDELKKLENILIKKETVV